jgi:hypothetical protein
MRKDVESPSGLMLAAMANQIHHRMRVAAAWKLRAGESGSPRGS